MRYLITLLLSIYSFPLWAVTGDIIGALVETNGSFIEVFVESKGIPASGNYTNGTGGFNFGFGTNNTGGNLYMTLNGVGYSTSGAATTPARTILLTHQLRLPYPNHTNNDITVYSATNACIRVALSDEVYASDNTLRLTIPVNWWSNNNAAAAIVVTNSSTLVWKKPAANWTCVPNQKAGSSFTLSVIAGHASAKFRNAGFPVQAVQVRSDSATAHITNWLALTKTKCPLVSTQWVTEWVTNVPTSSFAQGEIITNNFDVYPYLGDSILSSDDGVYNIQPGYSSIKYLCDKNETFCTNVAFVDAAVGNDTNGRVTNNSVANVADALYFATLDGAAKQLAATNASKGHNDTDGAKIFVRASVVGQNYAWVGGSSSYGTNGNKCWLEIERYSTNNLGDVVIGTQSGNQRLTAQGGLVKISGMMFTNSGAGGVIYGQGSVWANSNAMNTTSAALFYRATNCYFTANYLTNMTQGLYPGGDAMNATLVRDNYMTGFARKCYVFTVVGNYKGGKTTPSSAMFYFNGGQPGCYLSTNPIIAYNYFGGFVSGSGDLLQYPLALVADSILIANNVFESPSGGVSALVSMANDNTNTNQDGIISWNNTEVGERSSRGYNDLGTVAVYRQRWSTLNNIVVNFNTKNDTFTGNAPNGNRVGGFPILYGVNWSGNFSAQLTNVGAAFSFGWDFMGKNSYQPTTAFANGIPQGIANPSNYISFVSDASRSGTQTGGGNYRLNNNSPTLRSIQTSFVLPYDLFGNDRSLSDPPGAIAIAIPRRGMF